MRELKGGRCVGSHEVHTEGRLAQLTEEALLGCVRGLRAGERREEAGPLEQELRERFPRAARELDE